MNVSDSLRLAAGLEKLDYERTELPEEADVAVLNTCVVRYSAENKAYNRLMLLRAIKQKHPQMVINLMGCMVGVQDTTRLKKRFPFVDVFSAPSDPLPLVVYLAQRDGRVLENRETAERFARMDGDLMLPVAEQGKLVSAYISVVLGCSHACAYCIIPYRRGVERSRPPQDILADARVLASQGVREITLLGQIVDRYGKDQPGYPTLAALMRQMHDIEGVERIRFLTSHPNWMTDELLDCVAELPKVMPHIEVPIQAGNDVILENMARGYTANEYRRLIERIRQRIPNVSVATDVIVGFPGETAEQFQDSYDLLAELKMDVAHLARYSPRSGTVSARLMADDVSAEEKMRRFRALEILQEKVVTEIHARYLGQVVPILFEEKSKKRWKGRTPTNKLVFVECDEDLRGSIRSVKITWTGPWSMIGELV